MPKKIKDLYSESYTTVMKEIKGDTNQWRDIPFLDWKNQHFKNDSNTQSSLKDLMSSVSKPTGQGSSGFHYYLFLGVFLFPFWVLKRSPGYIVFQSLSCIWLFAASWAVAGQTSLSFAISRSSLKLTRIDSQMTINHCVRCRPLLLLPPIFPSIKVFSNESVFTSGDQNIGVSAQHQSI